MKTKILADFPICISGPLIAALWNTIILIWMKIGTNIGLQATIKMTKTEAATGGVL